jgi:hypothetical protein
LAQWRELPECLREGRFPPYTSPAAYQFRSDVAPLEVQRRIYEAIDWDDRIMSRGLRTLLRGLMLSFHPLFAEEAIYPLHVAMEVSFSLFRRQLRQEGHSDPSAFDAATRFEEIFAEEPSGERYFADYYDDRVMAQHPESRLGSSTYVPGTHGERLWLFKALREVYRYFLLQERVNPQTRAAS